MDDYLRIAQVATRDTPGGAARVAETLAEQFVKAGHSSELVVGFPSGLRAGVHSINGSGAFRLLERGVVFAGARAGLEDFAAMSPFLLRYRRFFREADVVQLHNLHGGYFNMGALRSISARKPTVWTLHDAWALTGHCAHPLECDRWTAGCGACPDLTLPPATLVDATALQMRLKRRAYERSEVVLVCPSKWLQGLVSRSVLSDHRRELIPNGVDTDVFRPRERRAVRDALGLPVDDTLVLLIVGQAGYPYKGHALLVETLQRMPVRPGLAFVAVGRADDVAPLRSSGHSLYHVPDVRDKRLMSLYLSAADVMVTTAVAETQGLAVVESMACGTPVVGFAVGGQPESIDDGKSGYLVPELSASALAAALSDALAEPSVLARLGRHAREAALERFDSRDQARRYLELYGELIEERRRRATQ